MATSKKTTQIPPSGPLAAAETYRHETVGKRTAVRYEESGKRGPGGFENIDAIFGAAKSPDPADIAAGEKPAVEEEIQPVRRPKPRTQPIKGPRFSFPGALEDDDNDEPIKESKAHAKVRNRNFSVSPSDLSTVSTAPPTPAGIESPLISHQETPLVTQETRTDSSIKTNNQASGGGEKHSTEEEDDTPAAVSQETRTEHFTRTDNLASRGGEAHSTEEEEDDAQKTNNLTSRGAKTYSTEGSSSPLAATPESRIETSTKKKVYTKSYVNPLPGKPKSPPRNLAPIEEPTVASPDIPNDDNEEDLGPPPPPEQMEEDVPEQEDDVPEAASQYHEEETFQVQEDDNDDMGDDGGGFEMADDHENDDVGQPSELDVEENKSDELNDDPPAEHEVQEKQSIRSPPNNKAESLSTEETNEAETAVLVGVKTPQSKKQLDKPLLGENEEESEPELATKTPKKDNNKQKAAVKLKSALKTPTGDNLATDDFGAGHEDDDDDDDDNEGEGSNMIHDPETPDSIREERIRKEQKEMEQKRKKKTKKKAVGSKENDSDSDDSTPVKPVKRRTKKKVKIKLSPRGYPSGPRGYSAIPVDDLVDDDETGRELRRSRRARTAPLEYWRNERMVYGPHEESGLLGEAMGNMPVVKSALKACETPYKKRKVPEKGYASSKSVGKKSRGGGEDPDEKPFDARRLKKKYAFMPGESAMVWNDAADDAVNEKVIAYSKNLERHDLPLPTTRKKSDGTVVGRAAQSFNVLNEANSDNYVGYIMGHLALPPKGIKDYESVGLCAQTFTVCHGQPNALEVSIADPEDEDRKYDASTAQRFLLGPGDMFRIPQNNTYQLKNHSKTLNCLLTWTIIRPHANKPED